MNFERIYGSKDEEIVSGVLELVEISQKSKEQDKNYMSFDRCREIYDGTFMDATDEKLMPWQSKRVNNQGFKVVETIAPFLLSGKPRVTAKPLNRESIDKVEIVNKIYQYHTETAKTGYQTMKADSANDFAVLGMTILAADFRDDIDPTGEVFYRQVDPHNFFIDPKANTDAEASFMIERKYMDIDTLIATFPDKEQEILDLLDGEGKGEGMGFPNPSVFGRFKTFFGYSEQSEEVDQSKRFNDIEVFYAYIRDTTKEKKSDESRNEDVYTPRYGERGRRIIVCDNVLLQDKKNPYPIIPYVVEQAYKLANNSKKTSIWGISILRLISTVAEDATKTTRRISDIFKQHAYPQKRIGRSCGIEPSDITNDPSQVIVADAGEFDLYSPNLAVTNDLLMWKREGETDCEQISGQNATVQGMQDYAGQSGVAIKNLQNLGTNKNELIALKMFMAWARIGEVGIKICLELYSKNKQIAISKPNTRGEVEFIEVNKKGNELSDIEFSMMTYVEDGTLTSREQKRALAERMFQLGIWGPQYVLKYIDSPDAEEVLAEIKQIAQDQAKMALLTQGQQPMPNAGGKNFGTMGSGTNLIQTPQTNAGKV